MPSLQAQIAIDAPAADVQEHIFDYFREHGDGKTETTLPLRVDLRDLGMPMDLAVERDVKACAELRRDEDNINDEIHVTWHADDGSSFPVFDGRLIVWSEDDPERSFVELRGRYEPPLRDAGALFNSAIGHKIAESTANNLLAEIARRCMAPEKSNELEIHQP